MTVTIPHMQRTLIVIFAGLILTPMAWISMSANIPTWWSPMSPTVFIIPLVLGMENFLVATPIPSLIFLVCAGSLFRGESTVPKISRVFHGIFTVLSIFYALKGLSYGIRSWFPYTMSVLLLNALVLILLRRILHSAVCRPSWWKNLCFQWLFVAWLFTYAFPWIGEGI